MPSVRHKLIKATVLLTGLQLLAQALGLLRQIVIAAEFGTTEVMDAYLVALTMVGLIQLWVSLPINQVLMPMFRHDLARQGERTAWANISVLFNNFSIVLVLVVALGWFAAPYVVQFVGLGLAEDMKAVSTTLTQIMMVSVLLMGMGTAFSQILFAYERFLLPGLAGGMDNLMGIVVLLALSNSYGIYGLAAAFVIGDLALLCLQLPILWEKRKLYVTQVNLRHPEMIEMGKLSVPLLLSTGGTQVERVTDRIFASLLPVGSLSALAFAHRLIGVLQDFFIDPLQQATFPHFTKLSAEEQFNTLSRQLFSYLRIVFFLTLPIAVGVMMIAEDVVRVLYQRGAFDETSVQLTSQALFFYAIGFPAQALSRILNRTYFSFKDTRTPSKLAILRIGIKIVLSWILLSSLSHRGIALAESLSQILRIILLFLFLPAQVKGQEEWNMVKSFARTVAAAALMAAVVYFAQGQVDGLVSMPLEIAALVLLGIAVYGLITYRFQEEEAQFLLKSVTSLGAKYLPSKS